MQSLELSAVTRAFIREHREEDVRLLALQGKRFPDIDMKAAATQIAGWQTAKNKIPSWAEIDDIIYPSKLPLEQCSSELTATYKAEQLNGESLVDLTGGLGVDCAFLTSSFKRIIYVERQSELCELAVSNFRALGLPNVKVNCCDAIGFLQEMSPVDCIFIDPARRDNKGGKTVAIADCIPDVARYEELLVSKATRVTIKLSPMLDLSQALRDLKQVKEVHVISVHRECRELLLFLSSGKPEKEIPIHCVDLSRNETKTFSFTREQEAGTDCLYADSVLTYIYEPNASILKAGAFKTVGNAFNVYKLHPNSHLYTADVKIADFPGRMFKVEDFFPFHKKETKKRLKEVRQANLTVRNFHLSVADLRKQLELKEGGNVYIFASTLKDGKPVVIKAVKIK